MSKCLCLLFIFVFLRDIKAGVDSGSRMKSSYSFVDPPPESQRPDLPPVILLHGMMDSRMTWGILAPKIANATGRKVYYLDARNHGDSPWTGEFSLDELANDVIQFMDDYNIPKATLVGHSMGGRSAITLALQKPERIEKIVVEDMTPRDVSVRSVSGEGGGLVLMVLRLMKDALSAIPEGSSERKAKLAVALYMQPLIPADMLPKSKVDMEFHLKNMPLKKEGDHYTWKTNLDLLEKALISEKPLFVQNLTGSFAGEALFLYGADSFVHVGRDTALIKRLFPNAELVNLKNHSHLIHHQNSKLFLEKVTDFINFNTSTAEQTLAKDRINMSYIMTQPPAGIQQDLPPVILIHGIQESKETWSILAPKIANLTGRTVYRVDCRNHGDSPWSDKFDIDVLVEDFYDFMESLRIPKAIFIGHSMGGKVGMTMALRKPDKVEKLIVEDMSPNNLSSDACSLLAEGLKTLRQIMDDIPQDTNEISARIRVAETMDKLMPPEDKVTTAEDKEFKMRKLPMELVDKRFVWKSNIKLLENSFRQQGKFDQNLEGQFPRNTLFLYGTESYFNVSSDEVLIKHHFPGSQMVGVEGAGHLLHELHKERFLQEVVDFINCTSANETGNKCKSKL